MAIKTCTHCGLKINSEYLGMVVRPPQDQYKTMKESIHARGQYKPIEVNKHKVIVDGYTRHQITKELGIKPKWKARKFANENEEKFFVIEANLAQRHLTNFQRIQLAMKLLPLEQALARERQRKAGKVKSSFLSNERKGEALELVAKKAGVSTTTFHRGKAILEHGNRKLIKKVQEGAMEINTAYNQVVQHTRHGDHKKNPPLPKGVYNILYVDPPWQYENQNTGGSLRSGAEQQYPTMSTDEICKFWEKLHGKVAKDSVIFLWATVPLLPEAFKVLDAWGFTYKTKITWRKIMSLGMGYWFRGQVEDLLVGIKGKVKPFRCQKANFIQAKVGKHSEKPKEFRELIELAVKNMPHKRKLEIFGRKKHDGWEVYGDELE